VADAPVGLHRVLVEVEDVANGGKGRRHGFVLVLVLVLVLVCKFGASL